MHNVKQRIAPFMICCCMGLLGIPNAVGARTGSVPTEPATATAAPTPAVAPPTEVVAPSAPAPTRPAPTSAATAPAAATPTAVVAPSSSSPTRPAPTATAAPTRPVPEADAVSPAIETVSGGVKEPTRARVVPAPPLTETLHPAATVPADATLGRTQPQPTQMHPASEALPPASGAGRGSAALATENAVQGHTSAVTASETATPAESSETAGRSEPTGHAQHPTSTNDQTQSTQMHPASEGLPPASSAGRGSAAPATENAVQGHPSPATPSETATPAVGNSVKGHPSSEARGNAAPAGPSEAATRSEPTGHSAHPASAGGQPQRGGAAHSNANSQEGPTRAVEMERGSGGTRVGTTSTQTQSLPTACQSNLFDCARARGVEFPAGFEAEEMFTHPLQDVIFVVGNMPTHPLTIFALPFQQFQKEAPVQPIACTTDFPADLHGVASREGAAPLFYTAHTYYQFDEATPPLTTDALGVPQCHLALAPLPLTHTCAGEAELLNVRGDWDLNADGVTDVIGAGRCDKAALWIDLLLSTPSKQLVAQTFADVAEASAFSGNATVVQTAMLDAGTLQVEFLSPQISKGPSPKAGPRSVHGEKSPPTQRVQCLVKLSSESGVVGAPSCTADMIGPMPDGIAVAVNLAGKGAKSFIIGSDGTVCKPPKSGKSATDSTGLFECDAKPGPTTSVKAAVGATVGSKGRSGKLPSHVVLADEGALHLATVADGPAGLSLQPMAGETLLGMAPLDGIGFSVRDVIDTPRAVTIVDLDHFGGKEVCALFTKRRDEQVLGTLLVCHRNRNEAPSIQLQTPAIAADTAIVTLFAVTDDPTNDTLATTWSFTDAFGSDVSQHFEVQGNTAIFHVPAEVPTSWNAWDLLLPTAHAVTETVAWPVTATAVTCDAGGACNQSTATVNKDLQVAGAVPVNSTTTSGTGGDGGGGGTNTTTGTSGTDGSGLGTAGVAGEIATGSGAGEGDAALVGKGAGLAGSEGTAEEPIVAFGYVQGANVPSAAAPANESGEQVPKVAGDPAAPFEGLDGGMPATPPTGQDATVQPEGANGDAASGSFGGFDFGGGGCSFIPR